jgi:hypothetical protein
MLFAQAQKYVEKVFFFVFFEPEVFFYESASVIAHECKVLIHPRISAILQPRMSKLADLTHLSMYCVIRIKKNILSSRMAEIRTDLLSAIEP